MTEARRSRRRGWIWVRLGLALAGFLAIAGYLLFAEHRAHIAGAALVIVLVICPLLYLLVPGVRGKKRDARPERRPR